MSGRKSSMRLDDKVDLSRDRKSSMSLDDKVDLSRHRKNVPGYSASFCENSRVADIQANPQTPSTNSKEFYVIVWCDCNILKITICLKLFSIWNKTPFCFIFIYPTSWKFYTDIKDYNPVR